LLKVGGGFARIYGPDGADLATPLPPEQEGILYADINLDAITLAKVAADPVGHYSRNDVTRLLFNSESRRPVTADAVVGAEDYPVLIDNPELN
jgi:aliphatic nitrilase